MTSPGDPAMRGAYGLSLPDVPEAAELLLPAPDSWPVWRLRHRADNGAGKARAESVSADSARLRLQGHDGWVEIDRAESTSTLLLPRRPSDEELVHPFLAHTAAAAARWRGWNCFHAGGLIVDGEVWGILGDKGAGKSSSLAWFALETEAGVLNDDILVVDPGGRALAGPRCIDLRPDAAVWLGAGESIGIVGARERWRVRLGPIGDSAPLRGWVVLAWGESVEIRPLEPAERFASILRQTALRILPPDVSSLMDLVALPAWELTRPPRLQGIAAAADQLLATLAR